MKLSCLVAFFLSLVTHNGKSESPVLCDRPGSEQKPCQTHSNHGICISNECTVLTKHTSKQVLLKVRYNTTNSYITAKYKSPTMWIRGNVMGLTWTKGKKMIKTNLHTWQFLLTFNISSAPTKTKAAAKLEFRLYLNDEKDMLGANFHLALPVSMNTKHGINLKAIPITWVYPWFFSQKGTMTKQIIYSPQLKQDRNLTIYTPPSFQENQYKSYKTLFFNDGQRVHLLLPQLDLLIVQNAYIEELVIVGVVNTYEERVELLAPTNGTLIKCKIGNFSDQCGQCRHCTANNNCNYSQVIADYKCYKWLDIPQVKGQHYLDFIQNTLVPETQKSYRALPGAENVGIMGFSFGGLVACHAMWTRPKIFGSAACMSPSLWWPFPSDVHATFPDDTKYEFVRTTLWSNRGARARQKVYIDVGSEEGEIMINPARNASRILDESPYFELNKNLWFYIWENEKHEFTKSLNRIWVALLALYGSDGAPRTQWTLRNTGTTAGHLWSSGYVYGMILLTIICLLLC